MFKNITGVYAFYGATDIPGENNYTPLRFEKFSFVEPQEIFVAVNGMVKYHNQPCGMVVAERMDLANAAAKNVKIIYAKSIILLFAINGGAAFHIRSFSILGHDSPSLLNNIIGSVPYFGAKTEQRKLSHVQAHLLANIKSSLFSRPTHFADTSKRLGCCQ